MNIGRKIYYESSTGNVILDTGERQGDVVETTEVQDFAAYSALQPYQQSAVGVIQCNYGYSSDNFATYPFHIDITKNPIDQTAIVWDTANPYGATLAQVQAAKLAQITDLYDQKLAAGFTSSANGTQSSFGYTQSDQLNFMNATAEFLLKGTSAFPLDVYDKNGAVVVIDDSTQFGLLTDDIAAFFKPLKTKQHDYIVQVNACTTVDQVNAITIQF